MRDISHQQEFTVRIRHIDIIDGFAAAIGNRRNRIDHLDAVHQESQLLEAGLIVGEQTGPQTRGLLLQLDPGVFVAGCHPLSIRRVKMELDPPVRQDFCCLRLFHMSKGIGGVIGDEQAVEAKGSGIEGLILQKRFRDLHINLLFRRGKRCRS